MFKIGGSYSLKFEPIDVYGKRLDVEVIEADLRNGYAMVKGDRIIIKIPKRCATKRKKEIANELYGKISRSIRRRPESFLRDKRLIFYDGEKISFIGEVLTIKALESENLHSSAKVRNGIVYAKIGKDKRTLSELVESALCRHAKPYVSKLVRERNRDFGSGLGNIRVTKGLTIWGSCSRKNDISINIRLLFLDPIFIDYVIVHELAHTKVKSHSKRFWKVVEKQLPDYKETRKALRRQGYNIQTEAGLENPCGATKDVHEETDTGKISGEEQDMAPAYLHQRQISDFIG